MSAVAFQKQAFDLLKRAFPPDRVSFEFSIGTAATDVFAGVKRYLPRLDLAVGPFNVSTQRDVNSRLIRAQRNHPLIQKIISHARRQNAGEFNENDNPRCLLAIEIEFSGSSKLILGDFTNASMMGLVGLVIGPSAGKYMQQIRRVAEYVLTLRRLEKAPEHLFTNVACMDENEFKSLFNGL
jgi:hypothetical protein